MVVQRHLKRLHCRPGREYRQSSTITTAGRRRVLRQWGETFNRAFRAPNSPSSTSKKKITAVSCPGDNNDGPNIYLFIPSTRWPVLRRDHPVRALSRYCSFFWPLQSARLLGTRVPRAHSAAKRRAVREKPKGRALRGGNARTTLLTKKLAPSPGVVATSLLALCSVLILDACMLAATMLTSSPCELSRTQRSVPSSEAARRAIVSWLRAVGAERSKGKS